MHELPVTEEILKIAVDHAQRAHAQHIRRVNLVVGDLTSFLSESIQFYFDFLTKDTLAEGAELAIRRVPAQVKCTQCGAVFAPDGIDWRCTACHALGGEVLSGRELLIESIEVE
jgi:hydrogenase nickel incorporation protein HypA/HybF